MYGVEVDQKRSYVQVIANKDKSKSVLRSSTVWIAVRCCSCWFILKIYWPPHPLLGLVYIHCHWDWCSSLHAIFFLHIFSLLFHFISNVLLTQLRSHAASCPQFFYFCFSSSVLRKILNPSFLFLLVCHLCPVCIFHSYVWFLHVQTPTTIDRKS